MRVSELRSGLADFNQSAPIAVAIQVSGQPHEIKQIRNAGHIDHPDEVKTDAAIHALDIVCDPWNLPPQGEGPVETVAELATALKPYPDEMHVRVAVPMSHESISHRMLDIVMIGRVTGTDKGVQLVTEAWDNPMQVIKAIS